MRRLRTAITGLDTRIATRTFLAFALCAVLPIVLTVLISHRVVSHELRDLADARLARASKAYGLLVFERLRQSDELLTRLARMHLEGQLSAQRVLAFESQRIRITDLQMSRAPAGAQRSAGAVHLSVLREPGGEPQIALTSTQTLGDARISLTGVVAAAHLWNADAIELADARLCVRDATGAALHCTDGARPPQEAADPPLTGRWNLFLRPTYGVAGWTVEAQQSPQVALAALAGFRRTLPIASLIAIAIALLLSVVQIRRSHRPLAALTEAAARIAERRFAQPVVVNTHDEYGRLALAFNQMSASLARQFAALGALVRIDRLILATPSIEVVLEKTLPVLPRLLRVRAAAVVVQSGDRGEAQLYVSSRNDRHAVRLRRLRIGGDELRALLRDEPAGAAPAPLRSELAAVAGCAALHATPIRVDRQLRGVLLVGCPGEALHREQRRYARSFARRFAVALGAEERRQSLLRQAYYDDLTGLPNRQLFKDRLQQELAHAKRTGDRVALVYIDLDRFKNINDALGHSAGDELLRQVGGRLGEVVRDVDTLARLGGDEFVVIAAGANERPAHVLAERLQAALSGVAAAGQTRRHVAASMGLAVYPQDGDTAEILLRNADTAMYRAKAAGGARAVYFEEDMNRDAARRLDLEQRLRAALQEGALSLAYQPKARVSDGAVCGVEALARWTDAEFGPISPGEFIPIAEECGLIEELGDWAMLEACRTLQHWRRQDLDVGHMSVNVSLRQLRDERFVGRVQEVLQQTQTPAHALELEVTESMLAERPQQVMRLLEELRAIGVRIAIDDFGVGYSSMGALGHLPADALKIDRSFVEHCADSADAASVVEAIICMAHALGKTTVAEGVETAQQFDLLQSLGCDAIQGYFFSRPLPSDQVAGFCASLNGARRTASMGPAVTPAAVPGRVRAAM